MLPKYNLCFKDKQHMVDYCMPTYLRIILSIDLSESCLIFNLSILLVQVIDWNTRNRSTNYRTWSNLVWHFFFTNRIDVYKCVALKTTRANWLFNFIFVLQSDRFQANLPLLLDLRKFFVPFPPLHRLCTTQDFFDISNIEEQKHCLSKQF